MDLHRYGSNARSLRDEPAQRYAFMAWCLRQPQQYRGRAGLRSVIRHTWLPGLALEKATGRAYAASCCRTARARDHRVRRAEWSDKDQPWGHDQDPEPELTQENRKLNWLLAAGNIQLSLPDYARWFIQPQRRESKGAQRRCQPRSSRFLHQGHERFAVGWFWEKRRNGGRRQRRAIRYLSFSRYLLRERIEPLSCCQCADGCSG